MIADLEQLFGSNNPELVDQIRRQNRELAVEIIDRTTRPLPTVEVADWAQENVYFDEPKFRGPFSLKTRRYVEEPLNLWRRDILNDVCDLICCWATRSAKTRIPMAGAAYRVALDPMRCLWTKPMKHGAGGSRNDAKTKFIPMLKASPGLVDAVARCDKNSLNNNQQMINGSIIDWEGTGSAKQLSGNPDDVVVQDECDGYVLKGNTEAHPSVLADERTKDATSPLRYKSCSPTVEDGVIWQWLMQSDLRRRFLPCPRCSPLRTGPVSKARRTFDDLVANKFFVLAWSEQYHVLPSKMPDGRNIPMAFVKWDRAAKLRDGTWDINRVMQTAHFLCPHCAGPVRNHEKEWMDDLGRWHPTRIGAPGVAGFQLSSLYVTHDETAIGVLAKKFLMARESGKTMKGFINNDLAEVDVMQEMGKNQIELRSHPVAQTDWVAQLTADFQKNWPFMWVVVRKWCAFKLLPPFGMTGGKPDFVPYLEDPENASARKMCYDLVADFEPAWTAVAELMRFDSRTGRSPIIDFLLAQKIVGEKLVKLFREDAGMNTLTFRKILYQEMDKATGGAGNTRPPIGGDSELVAAGHMALSGEYVWDELREIIQHFNVGKGMMIPERCVGIDCGYAEKFNREVLRKCYESATEYKHYDPLSKNRPAVFYKHPIHNHCVPAPHNGWLPMKGYPMNQRWNHGGIKNELNMNVDDPFFGTDRAGSAVTEVMESPQGLFWLRKDDLRKKRAKQVYAVSPAVEWFPKIHEPDGTVTKESNFKMADYERQINEQFYDEKKGQVIPKHGKGGPQSRAHPYHLDDCETMQVVMATYNEFFDSAPEKK